MYTSKNTRSSPTTSNEVTTTYPPKSPYVAQTDSGTTIKDLIDNFDDKFKESLKETIVYQDIKCDAKFEKQLQPLLLHIKENFTKFPLKLYDQEK